MTPDPFKFFSQNAKGSLTYAEDYAKSVGEREISGAHLIVGFLKTPNCAASEILKEYGVSINKATLVLQFMINRYTDDQMVIEPVISEYLKQEILEAVKIAQNARSGFVGTEHLLLSIISSGESSASKLLSQLKVDIDQLRKEIEELIFGESRKLNFQENLESFSGAATGLDEGVQGKRKGRKKMIESFTFNVTEAVMQGKIDPVIGRDLEIDRVITILNRRTKNNPVLVGEPGVGKTAIVEGLAQRILANKVPAALFGKKILMLDLGLLVAGTKYRGEFEERFKGLLDEVAESNDTILFIDELHTIIGAGSAEGSLDAANMLKPPLARGVVRIIGATTFDEYRKKIEKDNALERRLQKVTVEEPSIDQAVEILSGIAEKYENYHKVRIPFETVKACVDLSMQYIFDRFLPDKAIDLLDESASQVSIENNKVPPELEGIEKELQEILSRKNNALSAGNFKLAGTLREKENDLIEKHRTVFDEKFVKEKENWPVVKAADVAKAVSKITLIPHDRISYAQINTNLSHLKNRLQDVIFGQNEAVESVSKVIMRSVAHMSDPNRPLGSFVFLGPTGVGKTELAKSLAREVFGTENALLHIDMSEYSEKFATSRLTGSPPGYVGYNDENVFEQIKKRPYSVVLFDEIEKAHPEVFNILLRILDEGRVTDANGRIINFKNTIIILTSNLGLNDLNREASIGFATRSDEEVVKSRALRALYDTFKPEFINRLDRIIVFNPLNRGILTKISRKLLRQVHLNLAQQGIELLVTDSAVSYLVESSFDARLGARPLRRAIEEKIVDKVTDMIISKEVFDGKKVICDANDGGIVFSTADSDLRLDVSRLEKEKVVTNPQEKPKRKYQKRVKVQE